MKLAMIQLLVKNSPEENIAPIKNLLKEAKALGADIAVLPEMCACPYENDAFVGYAMEKNHPFLLQLAAAAKENGLFLVAGSIPEKFQDKIYNTSYVFDPEGKTCAKHRKVHLFDINVEGGQYFMESHTFPPGHNMTAFETPWGKMGLCICYDIRFPEFSRLMTLAGVKGLIVPAAFNMTTGPAHWELTFRARALDNQFFVAGVAPARDKNASYLSWGHSISVDPWGHILAQRDETPGITLVEWDMNKLEKIRNELPLLKHLRKDLYDIVTP